MIQKFFGSIASTNRDHNAEGGGLRTARPGHDAVGHVHSAVGGALGVTGPCHGSAGGGHAAPVL